MITVGLVKELLFVSNILRDNILFKIIRDDSELVLSITPTGEMTVWYMGKRIWSEKIEGENSFFGVESCDNISRIIACIDNNDESWKQKYLFDELNEKNVDTISNLN